MKHLMALSVFLAASVNPVWGTPQTVTLSVPGMTCSACPITVKVALSKTPGVEKAEVSYEKRQARVVFDNAKTSATVLTQATANAGYPSSVIGTGK
ncbi:MAG: mercury resistance system periplasmic binding protein MerP [Polaromonas sp.]|uniref:mercury resistance system periplasmic binding protein MerP n=1 Tax=Polaromonas sp. TaxID=1869339 RepID=UPI002734C096|nr:mercury resistance system periplasmic binding protein MerP [Polaromonas sp.]MDP2818864.1 mercury resistance system periplasmic binding protein MerP [Polaromonas sp.]